MVLKLKIPTRVAKIKKMDNMEQLGFAYPAGGSANQYNHFEELFRNFS